MLTQPQQHDEGPSWHWVPHAPPVSKLPRNNHWLLGRAAPFCNWRGSVVVYSPRLTCHTGREMRRFDSVDSRYIYYNTVWVSSVFTRRTTACVCCCYWVYKMNLQRFFCFLKTCAGFFTSDAATACVYHCSCYFWCFLSSMIISCNKMPLIVWRVFIFRLFFPLCVTCLNYFLLFVCAGCELCTISPASAVAVK